MNLRLAFGLVALLAASCLHPSVSNAQFGALAQRQIVGDAARTLNLLLTAELHFVQKVCQPSPQQFNKIHLAGLAAVKNFQERMDVGRAVAGVAQLRSSSGMTVEVDPSNLIAEALAETVQEIMPSTTWKTYHREIVARAELRRQASAAMMVQMIDQFAVLDAKQAKTLEATIINNWKTGMSPALTVMSYPQYAVLPDSVILRPHLSSLQQRLWSYRPNHRSIRLPWESQLAPPLLFEKELPPFPDPMSIAVEPSKQPSRSAGAAE